MFLVKLSIVCSHIAYGGAQAMRGWQVCHKTMYHSPAAGMMEEARQAGCIKDVGHKACSKGQDIVVLEQEHAEQALQSFCAKSG